MPSLHTLLPTLLLAAHAATQSFSFPGFAGNTGLIFRGQATLQGFTVNPPSILVALVPGNGTQAGAIWYPTPLWTTAGFDTSISTLQYGNLPYGNFAFVLHEDTAGSSALGGAQGAMGYANSASTAGIRRSLAIEFDTQIDPWDVGPSIELSVHATGNQPNDKAETLAVGRVTGLTPSAPWHVLRILYTPPMLTLFLNGTQVLQVPYHMQHGGTYLAGGAAPGALPFGMSWAGITGEGGIIADWQWSSAPPPCYSGTSGMGNPLLTVQGSSGPTDVETMSPFDITLQTAPAFGPGAPYILLADFGFDATPSTTTLPFGVSCFPMLGAGAAPIPLADSFGIVAAAFPAGLTPHTLTVPFGTVPFPLDVALQAVTLASSSPLALGLTNAIPLRIVSARPPEITSVSPLTPSPGQPVTIQGTHFVPGCSVQINGVAITPTSVNNTAIVFPCPPTLPCASTVLVTNPSQRFATTTINPAPTVNSTVFGSGTAAGGANFVVIGSGFGSGTTVTIGGAPATVNSVTATLLMLTTPPGPVGVAPVVIRTAGNCTATTTYTYH